MLFALNGQGTPSIARWIKLLSGNGDLKHPTRVQDLTLEADSYSSADSGVTVEWTPPAADSGEVDPGCVGPAQSYQLRYRFSMTSWPEFAAGTLVSTPAPDLPGAPRQSARITGLTGYHISVRLTSKNY